jgi:hypothetical protein
VPRRKKWVDPETVTLAQAWGVDPEKEVVEGRRDGELMSIAEFREWLAGWRLSVPDFAYLTGYHVRTVIGWGCVRDGRPQPVPKVVCRLMDAWALNGGPPNPEELLDAGQTALVITRDGSLLNADGRHKDNRKRK